MPRVCFTCREVIDQLSKDNENLEFELTTERENAGMEAENRKKLESVLQDAAVALKQVLRVCGNSGYLSPL